MMATAADYVIAEVEELVELGQLDPNQVHTPGIFIDAIFRGPKYEKASSAARLEDLGGHAFLPVLL